MKYKSKKIDYTGYVYILPSVLLITFFSFIPIIYAFYYSFNDYNVMQPEVFVGLKNYNRLFSDPFVVAGIKNTLLLVAVVVPLQTVFSMMLASVIAARKRTLWIGFVKSTLFIPVISSMMLVGIVWKVILAVNGGIMNVILENIGLSPINWLGNKRLALISICIVTLWKNVGYYFVLYLAAILDIPKEYYEAATVDGANNWQQFKSITLPLLKPVTFLVVTVGAIWSFQIFDLVYIMTGGGPGTSTSTLVLAIYSTAFKSFRMGYGSAIAMLLFAIIIVMTILQKRLLSDKEEIGGKV